MRRILPLGAVLHRRRYKHHLALMVVDKNHTQIAMKALLSHERTEKFLFLFEMFTELCAGAHPQMIYTVADQAETSAIAQTYASSLHKFCLYHIHENIRKHGRGLGEGVLAAVQQKFNAAAYAPTEDMFLQYKAEALQLLTLDSHMYKNMFDPGRVQKWAAHVHSGLHTLSIASTQRVESTNSALKRVMTRSGNMVDVENAIVGNVQDGANKTARLY